MLGAAAPPRPTEAAPSADFVPPRDGELVRRQRAAGPGRPRQDQHPGVRTEHLHLAGALRPDAESLRRTAQRRRVERRIRLRSGLGHASGGPRNRQRGIDPDTGQQLRPLRPEAVPRPGAARQRPGGGAGGIQHRPRGDAQRARLRPDPGSHRRDPCRAMRTPLRPSRASFLDALEGPMPALRVALWSEGYAEEPVAEACRSARPTNAARLCEDGGLPGGGSSSARRRTPALRAAFDVLFSANVRRTWLPSIEARHPGGVALESLIEPVTLAGSESARRLRGASDYVSAVLATQRTARERSGASSSATTCC